MCAQRFRGTGVPLVTYKNNKNAKIMHSSTCVRVVGGGGETIKGGSAQRGA